MAFHVKVPATDCPFTVNLYCVMRFEFGSYVNESLSEEPKVIPVAKLATLYAVAVTGFCPELAEMVLILPSPSGAYVKVGNPVMPVEPYFAVRTSSAPLAQ